MTGSEAAFDDLAEDYDRYRIGYAPEIYDALADHGIVPGRRVLDVACGTGLVAEGLATRGCIVTGIDASQPMLRKARQRVPAATFVLGSAERMPFADGAFDGVTCAQAFHWFEAHRALAEIIRVVRPGGAVAVWWKGYMRGDVMRLVCEEVTRDLGLVQPPDVLTQGFDAFEQSPLVDKTLRVVPWIVERTVADTIGYERARARARSAYGDHLDAYVAALAERLGAPESRMSLALVQMVYLGRVPPQGDG